MATRGREGGEVSHVMILDHGSKPLILGGGPKSKLLVWEISLVSCSTEFPAFPINEPRMTEGSPRPRFVQFCWVTFLLNEAGFKPMLLARATCMLPQQHVVGKGYMYATPTPCYWKVLHACYPNNMLLARAICIQPQHHVICKGYMYATPTTSYWKGLHVCFPNNMFTGVR